jgi:hypothetical protein
MTPNPAFEPTVASVLAIPSPRCGSAAVQCDRLLGLHTLGLGWGEHEQLGRLHLACF